MALRTIPVDTSKISLYFLKGNAKTDEDGKQLTNFDDQLMWRVSVLAVGHAEDGQDSTLNVSVPSAGATPPYEGMTKLSRVSLENFRAGTFAQRDGAQFYFAADEMAPWSESTKPSRPVKPAESA